MNLRRLPGIFPLLLAFALLFAQQQGMEHVLHHALEELARKHGQLPQSHSGACQKCADYAQHGSALGAEGPRFVPFSMPDAVPVQIPEWRGATVFAVAARGPPLLRAA